MASQWLKARQTKYAAYATTYTLVVLAVVVVANYLANRYSKQYDATANKRYSLSQETKKIVDGLKQDATITYFNVSTHFGEGKDILDEYKAISPKVHVKYVDPVKEPMLARQAGIRNEGTATVQVGDHTEIASDMTEEGLTGALIRDIKGNTRTVCFVTGSGEHQTDDSSREGESRFKDLLDRDSYQTKSISLVATASVPADCTAIVIDGPTRNYEQPEVDAIKTYVQGGGRALFMLDPPLNMGPSSIGDNASLLSLLESWGVTADKDLVLDLNPIGQLYGFGGQVALVNSYGTQPIVADMKTTFTGFPLARSLTFRNTDKSSVEKLFDTSDSSFATTNLSSPKINVKDPNNKRGPLTLGVAGTYNTGKSGSEGRFVVIGSSAWASNSFISFNGNGDLATNSINWLTSDEDLISIRPKKPEDRRITMTSAQLNMVRLISQFVLPLIVIAGGILVWWKRR
ncbi:MAG TPA: GldG family protein [Acidobacteriaceae bacterium]|nr:GldG family protein [Acidobacteriaceae bacterium]